jgi:putative pyruvate formate lyase activating enzyme
MEHCSLCPRNCGIDRKINEGYCGTGSDFSISSIVIHRGEEPVISGPNGICNIFFTGCNLRCIYCQNFQISRPTSPKNIMTIDQIVKKISNLMENGITAVGFVSTSHVVNQVIAIIEALHKEGLYPVIVYNTNAYEKPETINLLEGKIDIYLPDFKYISSSVSKEYSGASDYFQYASASLTEMYRQKGSTLFIDEKGRAESGLIIRHLVLPCHCDESIKVLQYIAREISTRVHISLMSQYYPAYKAIKHPKLGRSLFYEEYQSVMEEFHRLGFRNGWVQKLESKDLYRPNFEKEIPFY